MSKKKNPTPPAITYKGRKIGRPKLLSTLHVLPPASRFVRKAGHASSSEVMVSYFHNAFSLEPGQEQSVSYHGRNARLRTSLLPPLQDLPAAPCRSATAGRLAGVCTPVNHAQGEILHEPDKPPKNNIEPHRPGLNPNKQGLLADRKWDALPALPPGERPPEPPPKDLESLMEVVDDDSFDTEEVLGSLRPERLGLYDTGLLRCALNHSADTARNAAAEVISSTAGVASDYKRVVREGDDLRGIGDQKSCTRDCDLQSFDTDDSDIDNQLEKQEELVQRAQRLPLKQWRQENVLDHVGLLCNSAEEIVTNPETIFYNELVAIVKDYQEQLKQVIQRAHKVGEMSEGFWLREKRRHITAMETRIRAAENTSGYSILTAENDIIQAARQPIGYAIYSSLLKIRDPEAWQRVFEPSSSHRLVVRAATVDAHAKTQSNTLRWLACRFDRALRFVLAVPGDMLLKVFSSRHSPSSGTITYRSPVSVFGPTIPSRPSPASDTLPISQSQYNICTAGHSHPSTHNKLLSNVSNIAKTVTGNGLFTNSTLVSPLDGRYDIHPPRSKGYEHGTYVTVVSPSVVSKASRKKKIGNDAGRMENNRRAENRESVVTTWPQLES